jgi:hypothetical protein
MYAFVNSEEDFISRLIKFRWVDANIIDNNEIWYHIVIYLSGAASAVNWGFPFGVKDGLSRSSILDQLTFLMDIATKRIH